MNLLVAFSAGLIFALGLIVSGMVNPAKVLGFLDVAGAWDPTLVMVMLGALAVTVPAFQLILRRPRPLLSDKFELPTKTQIDGRLIVGSSLFGIGWGLVGFCPGPAVTALASGLSEVFVFVAAMVAGMAVHKVVLQRSDGTKLTKATHSIS